MTPEWQLILQLSTLGVGGVVAAILLLKVLPDMNATHKEMVIDLNTKHEIVVAKLIEECHSEKSELRKEAKAEAKDLRAEAAAWRKRDSDRWHKVHDEISKLRRGTNGSQMP